MRAKTICVCMAVIAVGLCCSFAGGSLAEEWSFERLRASSDLVVVGTVSSINAYDEQLKDSKFSDDTVSQVTTFRVETVLKGEIVGRTGPAAEVSVVHYRLKEGKRIENGPELASFGRRGGQVRSHTRKAIRMALRWPKGSSTTCYSSGAEQMAGTSSYRVRSLQAWPRASFGPQRIRLEIAVSMSASRQPSC